MSRRSARKNAFCLLFQLGFHEPHEESLVREIFFSQNPDISGEDGEFINKIVDNTLRNIEGIDGEIGSFSKGWTTKRMSRVDLSILRLAVCEMTVIKETPTSVVINEAVELAKKYSSDEAPAFINGILGELSKGEK